MKNASSTVLEEPCWDNFHTSQWKVLASSHDLLKTLHTDSFPALNLTGPQSRLHLALACNLGCRFSLK